MKYAVIAIGKNGGKIVGFGAHGKPIYEHEAPAPKAEPGSPAATAAAAGLHVAISSEDPSVAHITWPHVDQAKAKAWFQQAFAGGAPPGTSASKSSHGGAVRVPVSWAAKAPAAKKPAPGAPAKKKQAPASSKGPQAILPPGWWHVDHDKLQPSAQVWTHAARQPVTVEGHGDGVLLGRVVTKEWESEITKSLRVELANGKRITVIESAVKPKAGPLRQPWADCAVATDPKAIAAISAVLDEQMHGAGKTGSINDCIGDLASKGVTTLIWGGTVRDAVQGIPSKDVDAVFLAPVPIVKKAAEATGWGTTWASGKSGLTRIGAESSPANSLEGKPAFVTGGTVADQEDRAVGGDLKTYAEAADFAFNALAYDPQNKAVIDPTGHGIADAASKTIRPTVPPDRWKEWLAKNPSVVVRYFKFRARGYAPTPEMSAFIGANGGAALKGWGKHDMNGMLHKGGYLTPAFKKAVIDEMGTAFYQEHFA